MHSLSSETISTETLLFVMAIDTATNAPIAKQQLNTRKPNLIDEFSANYANQAEGERHQKLPPDRRNYL